MFSPNARANPCELTILGKGKQRPAIEHGLLALQNTVPEDAIVPITPTKPSDCDTDAQIDDAASPPKEPPRASVFMALLDRDRRKADKQKSEEATVMLTTDVLHRIENQVREDGHLVAHTLQRFIVVVNRATSHQIKNLVQSLNQHIKIHISKLVPDYLLRASTSRKSLTAQLVFYSTSRQRSALQGEGKVVKSILKKPAASKKLAGIPPLGCSKCRYLKRGCTACKTRRDHALTLL